MSNALRSLSKRNLRRWAAVPTAAACLLLGLAGCGSRGGTTTATPTGNKPITVCIEDSLTGAFALIGQYDAVGAEAYLDSVNRSGGVLGHHIKYVVNNIASSPANATTITRKCVLQNHANFILGPDESSTVTASVPIADSLKTITVEFGSGWGTAETGLPAKDLNAYAFPSIADSFHWADVAMLEGVMIPKHYTRIAVLQDDVPGATGNGAYLASNADAKKNGIKVVAQETLTPGSTNDTPQVTRMMAKDPQLVMLALVPGADTLTALKAVKAANPTLPIGMCLNCDTSSFIASAGGVSGMKDVYMLGTPSTIVDGPNNASTAPAITATKAFLAGMKAAGDTSSLDIENGGTGWDGAAELINGIKAAGSLSVDKVRDALQHQNINVGGFISYYVHRSPSDYAVHTAVVPIATVSTSGKAETFNVVKLNVS
jgi:branched-chain amino acid transport system substrate-binding protein